jgi:hypothetical protein
MNYGTTCTPRRFQFTEEKQNIPAYIRELEDRLILANSIISADLPTPPLSPVALFPDSPAPIVSVSPVGEVAQEVELLSLSINLKAEDSISVKIEKTPVKKIRQSGLKTWLDSH